MTKDFIEETIEKKAENLAREFCSKTPRIKQESGVVFYERLNKAFLFALQSQRTEMMRRLPEFKFPNLDEYLNIVEKASEGGKYDEMYENGFNAALTAVRESLSAEIKK